MAINGGYLGIAQINGNKFRCTAFTVNVKQDVQFYDHILGLRDSAPSGNSIKGDVGELNVQKYAWRPGVKVVSGNISFPATVGSLQQVYDLAQTGDDFTLRFDYSCPGEVRRTFSFCKINSMSFSVTAGDIVNVELDIIGRAIVEDEDGSPRFRTSQKLITWDVVRVTSDSSDEVFSLNFTVNNNCMPIYTAGSNQTNDLFPKKIRVGMQEVTGIISYYKKGVDYVGLNASTDLSRIGIDIRNLNDRCDDGAFVEELCVIYKPIERSGNIGAIINSLPFVGVGRALGTVDE